MFHTVLPIIVFILLLFLIVKGSFSKIKDVLLLLIGILIGIGGYHLMSH